MSEVVLALKDVGRSYKQGRTRLDVLRSVDLSINEGEIVGLLGPSGSGKSTLLHVTGLLENPDQGEVHICGEACKDLNDDARTSMRRHNIGFVYQNHHLLPEFSALENIIIPQIIAGHKRREASERADKLLDWMGLKERAGHRPGKLSGGEQQRVAIARALANGPRLLLADEPTGNLDPGTSDEVFKVLLKLVRGAGLAALIATHNMDLAAKMDRIVRLEDGILVAG